MQKYKTLLQDLLELRRLMRLTGMKPKDALGLLLVQLRVFEREEQLKDDLQHADYPRHVYGV